MIIDDEFLSEQRQKEIEKFVTSFEFPWYAQNVIVEKLKNNSVIEKGINPLQFVHGVIKDYQRNSSASSFNIILPILQKLSIFHKNDIQVLRAKFNLLQNINDSTHHWPHLDTGNEELKICLYYVNDSDGDTYFFDDDGKVIHQETLKRGKAILFNNTVFHASSSPTKNSTRIVLNINYELI
jgi:antitoxin component YwqK of YwqJK toxin-antitoxin module